ncbi:MAG: aspartate-semialdehyde dehydrogenase [Bacteroidia bacterium]|nr:aspartate-semialdehyde dehydrogenase [Bacteroidia bacterium]MDW8133660.1 aspartate-semialdehyde dehydrogenase [Bacteroidia bacterium]
MRLGVVGVTGLVGRTFLQALPLYGFDRAEVYGAASHRSVGSRIPFRTGELLVESVESLLRRELDIVFFSAGASVSREWAPRFVEKGAIVIDNSSAWRLEPNVPLIVPEVNLSSIGQARLIANPNCSTIQLVVVIAPLQRTFGIERVVISTYQAVTGTGQKAVEQLMAERSGRVASHSVYPHPIDLNCIPQCDVFEEEGYTREEWKIIKETRKILDNPTLPITATAVRVPVLGGHSESVNVVLKQEAPLEAVKEVLAQAPGIVLQDNPTRHEYPMPRYVGGQNEVFVGRIRRDTSHPRGINLWIVADNLRKGAATNALQIAQHVVAATQH